MTVLGLHCRARAFSSCGEQGLLFVAAHQLLIAVPSLIAEHGLQAHSLQQLWYMGLVAPQHVGSSWTRARSCVPCIGRRILNHCATREVPHIPFLFHLLSKQGLHIFLFILQIMQSERVFIMQCIMYVLCRDFLFLLCITNYIARKSYFLTERGILS